MADPTNSERAENFLQSAGRNNFSENWEGGRRERGRQILSGSNMLNPGNSVPGIWQDRTAESVSICTDSLFYHEKYVELLLIILIPGNKVHQRRYLIDSLTMCFKKRLKGSEQIYH